MSCLGGTLTASRECINGDDGVTVEDEDDCPGDAEETRDCNDFECSGGC